MTLYHWALSVFWGLQLAGGKAEGKREVRPSTQPQPKRTSSLPAFVHKTEKVMMVFLPLFKKTTESKQTEKGNSPAVALPELKGGNSPSHDVGRPTARTGSGRGKESTPGENSKCQRPPPPSPDPSLALPLAAFSSSMTSPPMIPHTHS